MSGCRKCNKEVSAYNIFCPGCGARLKIAIEFDPKWKPPIQPLMSRLRDSLDPKSRRWEKMTPYGSVDLEREISDLIARSVNVSERSELYSELALAYSMRASSEAYDMGRYQVATQTYSLAVAIEPDNADWRLQRAGVYLEWARQIYSPFLEALSLLRGQTSSDNEGKEEAERLTALALEDYNAILAIDPHNTRALMERATLNGKLEASNEDCKKALSVLSRAIVADSNDGESLEERAKIFSSLDMKDEAREDYMSAYQIASMAPFAQHSKVRASLKLDSLKGVIDTLQREG